jgi:hypothetical protein
MKCLDVKKLKIKLTKIWNYKLNFVIIFMEEFFLIFWTYIYRNHSQIYVDVTTMAKIACMIVY